jgi:prepilin-type processing-associated H-X9-DG protein
MLVVIAVIGILVAILLPALVITRESSRSTNCQSNLRQFGIALNLYADTHDALCSGAFDWLRDGVPTEVGWVADAVNSGVLAGQLLCPSNPHRLAETYNPLLNEMPISKNWSCGVDHMGSSPRTLPDGSLYINPCRIIVGQWSGSWTSPWGMTYTGGAPLAAGSEERRKLVEEMFYKPGYNTNYAASWWLVRSGVNVTKDGNLPLASGKTDFGSSCPAPSNLERTSTYGPLRRRLMSSNGAPSSNLPLLGDGSEMQLDGGVLSHEIAEHQAGEMLVESFSDGPVENATMKPPSFAPNTPRKGPTGWWSKWVNETRQDYRDFAPVHRGRANILMADGSVRTYKDQNKDGFLNNGFDPANYTGSGEIGFTEANEELLEHELFSGYSIRRGEMRDPR